MDPPGYRGNRRNGSNPPPPLFEDTSMSHAPPGQAPGGYAPGGYDDPWSTQWSNPGPAPNAPYAPSGGFGEEPTQASGMLDPTKLAAAAGFSAPMAGVAAQYGQQLADQGRVQVEQKLESWFAISKLKYYFAVDNSYVGKKLALLLFPYVQSDWSVPYDQAEPVAPRDAVNAPDLYIPLMGFVTYILVAGLMFGTNNRFTPEALGMLMSSAMAWMVLEVGTMLLSLYILAVSTELKIFDLLAFSGYKYVGMVGILLSHIFLGARAGQLFLLWASGSISYFLVQTLRIAILPEVNSSNYAGGHKRRIYLLLFIGIVQPFLMYWLSSTAIKAASTPHYFGYYSYYSGRYY